jgi:hypothetical protein
MSFSRSLVLAAALGAFGWFHFGQPQTATALVASAGDAFDRRPARTVLILGNSRTYSHDMPDMIRLMADSAHDPQKLEITLDAQAGGTFETLWNDTHTQDLLRQRWDDVVLQAESRAQSSDDLGNSFQIYGGKLIEAVHPSDGQPRLVVNWPYDSKLWDDGDADGSGRAALSAKIQSDTATLGARTGAHLVNVGRLWSYAEHDCPDIPLTEDGNHPSLAGSYLFALALYGDISGHDVGAVTYVPDGLDPAVAAKLRTTLHNVQSFL